MPSGLVNFRTPLLSPMVKGSYRTLTYSSIPFYDSAAAAGTLAASALKSQAPGPSIRSTFTAYWVAFFSKWTNLNAYIWSCPREHLNAKDLCDVAATPFRSSL